MELIQKVYHLIKKYWKIICLSILIGFIVLNQLFWMLACILGIFVLRFIFLFFIKFIKNKLLSKIAKGFAFFILILVISIGMKLFVFGVFRIPSSSMENTLYPDDIILVNKLVYGPKLPNSPFEIPWINLLFFFNDNARSQIDKEWWKHKRLSGINNIEKGDVLVFQETRAFFIVKRCVGLPGDNFKIVNGEVFANNVKYAPPIEVKENYNLIVKNKEEFYNQLDSLNIETMLYPSSEIDNAINGILSKKQYLILQKLSSIVSIDKKQKKYLINDDLFLEKNVYNWSEKSMGEFIIPKIGLEIKLNEKTFNVYKKTLQKFEKVLLEKKENMYFLDGKNATTYTFKKDYIFVLGDNREISKDSRYIGFIPVESIVGKVQYVLYSNYNDTFNWRRLFKGVN